MYVVQKIGWYYRAPVVVILHVYIPAAMGYVQSKWMTLIQYGLHRLHAHVTYPIFTLLCMFNIIRFEFPA